MGLRPVFLRKPAVGGFTNLTANGARPFLGNATGMNKVHKSVWNAAAGTYVAAAETTRARGKKSSGSKAAPSKIAGAFTLAGLALAAQDANALLLEIQNPQTSTSCEANASDGNPRWGLFTNPDEFGTCGNGATSKFTASGQGNPGTNIVMWSSTNKFAGEDSINLGGYLDVWGTASLMGGVRLNGTKITGLADGTDASDAVNWNQLYQRTRYFNASSASSDPSSDAKALGSNSVASGPYALATANNSSAYGAHASAVMSNSVALGANSVASRSDSVSVGYLTSDGVTQYTRQITNVTAGAAGTDAVNVDQLNAAIKSVSGGSSGGGNNPNAVLYNDSGMGLITLQGSKGTKITNLIAGDISSAWSTDAVNGSQLYQTNQNVADVASNLANVAGNVTNITNTVNNIVNNGIAGSPLVVLYDTSDRNSVTLGGVGSAKKVKLTNVANGDLSDSSTDAVNGSQLYMTNQNLAGMAAGLGTYIKIVDNTVNNIMDGGGIKYFHTNSTLADSSATGADAVAIGGAASASALNSVALGSNSVASRANAVSVGATGTERQIINVAAGTTDTDAVNVKQLSDAIKTVAGGGSPDAVIYDDAVLHNKVTLGGKGSTTPVALTNVAAGQVTSTSSDAVNGSQLYGTANSVAAALGGGTSVSPTGTVTTPTYALGNTGTFHDVGSALDGINSVIDGISGTISDTTKYIKVVSAGSAANATGGEAVAVGGNSFASGKSSVAIGAGATAQFLNSTAIGANAYAAEANVVSFGDTGIERRLTNVADGTSAHDVATFGQLTALQQQVNQLQPSGVKSMLLGATVPVTNYIAVSTTVTAGAATSVDNTKENAMAIGPSAFSGGENSVVVGAQSSTSMDNVTVVGSSAGAMSANATAIGTNASVGVDSDSAVAIGYMARATGANALVIGAGSKASAANSTAIGSKAMATVDATGSMAFGANATVSAANSVALGAGSMATLANTVSVGAAGSERQIVNVKAGSADTDAVNVKQLSDAIKTVSGGGAPDAVIYDSSMHDKLTLGGKGSTTPVALTNVAAGQIKSGSSDAVNGGQLYDTANSVAAALGGNSSVDANGKVVKPAYALDGTTYSDVGAALAAVNEKAGTGSANGVSYDTDKKDKVTFGGTTATTPVTLANVAAGVANNDAVNVKQLTDAGLTVDTSGNVTNAFVAYDSSSKNKVTLGGFGSTTPVSLTNIAAGQVTQSSKDAINGSQLYGTASSVAQALGGGSSVTTNGSVTKPTYTVAGSTYGDVGSAVDALNSLGTTGSPLGVVYDSSKRDKLTLGGNGATTAVEISNVAAGTADNDAVNLKQLKDAGLNVDTSGNVTNAFVAYDNASKNTVTFGGLGSTTPVQLKNVAAASDLTDAVNFGQMKDYVSQNAGSGGTANAVAYDDSSKNTVTLGGAGHDPVTLTNVAAGTNAYDAVNYSQFSSLQSQVNNLAGGGTGDTTYININTPASGGTAAVSSGTDAIAIGNGAVASGTAAIAIGKDAVTAGDNSVALGQGASAPNTNSVALGSNSTTDRDNSVSVGSAGNERQITNVAAGTQATDAVNLGQLNNAMGGMQQSINNVDRSAAKGIASASALNIVTPYLPGRTTLNAGVANYRGYQAVGLGVSRWNEKGTINYNLGVSTSGGNSTIVRAGIGIVLGN
jgi:autotransporter adhesin